MDKDLRRQVCIVKGNRLIDTFTTLEEAYRKGVEFLGMVLF